MPRACLRHARSLTSHSSPLLPFLAPRAFAAASYSTGRDDRKSQKEQEAKKEDGIERRGGLNGRPEDAIGLGARYADIFAVAGQQLRSYSTKRDGAGGRKRPLVRRVPLGNSGKPVQVRTVPSVSRRQRAVPRRKVRKVVLGKDKDAPWSPKGLERHSSRKAEITISSKKAMLRKRVVISDRRRVRRLMIVRRSFRYYMRYEYSKMRYLGHLRMDGKYRSLRRRTLGLRARESQVVRLTKPFDALRKSTGEYITMAFAALDRHVYSRWNRRSYPIILEHHPMCAEWAARLFNKPLVTKADQIWNNWNSFEPETREEYWPHLLIFLLDKFPYRALPFLQALTHRPCVASLDPVIIADAFENLARAYINKGFRYVAQRAQLVQTEPDFIPIFYHVYRDHLASHRRICSQDLLLCLPKLAGIEDFKRLYDLLQESEANIGYHVMLHYTNTFAKAGDFRQALACLKLALEGTGKEGVKARLEDEDRIRWSCALILHRSMKKPDTYHETTAIVAAFVELGIKLDILIFNVVIYNAMTAGDNSTAFKVFNSLDDNGLEPDKITFSTLLHGCTMTTDPAKYNDFAEYCAETAKEIKDPWLAADYLYFQFVCLHRESQEPEEKFGRAHETVQTYLRFFSPRALVPIWAADFRSPMQSQDGALAESVGMEPPPVALYIMIQLEIFKASSISINRLWTLYETLNSLVREGYDPVLTELARNPIIWNAFLLAFSRGKNFEHASQVIRNMPLHGAIPNVYTWNIFMQGFFKDRQIRAAERVAEIMRGRGIQPDEFSYEVLLRGYARAKHVRRVAEIMSHVSEERQDDPKLLRDLARIPDQKGLLHELENARVMKEEWMRLEQEAKERWDKERWAPPKFSSMLKPQEEPLDSKEGPRIRPLFEPGPETASPFGSMLNR